MEKPKDRRFVDLTDQKFGRLTVIKYSNHERKSYGNIHYWQCKCDCGATVLVEGKRLKSGNTQSCGCYQKDRAKETQFEDLTGKVFRRLTVLSYAGMAHPDKQTKGYKWLCKCECGTEKEILGMCLKAGTTQSCGCYHKYKIHERLIDLTGQVFGRLMVLESDQVKNGQMYWWCQCECSNKKSIAGNSLKSGKSKSCGCRQGQWKHGLSGKREYKKYYLKNPINKIRHNVSTAVRDALTGRKSGKSILFYLPYTIRQLKDYLESQFESWMTWNNYGGLASDKRKTWWIDHIVPQTAFPYKSLDDPLFVECWALSNLRPLEKIANIKKGISLQHD